MDTNIFAEYESNVRSYCRSFPDVFTRAKGSFIYGESDKKYIDFFAGAGALNYGHNNDYIKQKIVAYLESDGIIHSLDMYTSAKREFLQKFSESILEPKDLGYKVQFCGPTGTNAIEAALKLARKVKGRSGICAFMGGYHGLSLGSLAVSGSAYHRAASVNALGNVTFLPYPHEFMSQFDTIEYIDTILVDPHSGIDKPAAMIFETVQAEGGVIVAPVEWIQRLRSLCDKHDILLICDDIQVGCCRTGSFFSFERAGIVPDMVALSKSISGYGMPMSILLFKPELDVWQPAEHTGTFRGNQLAYVGATAALDYLESHNVRQLVSDREEYIRHFLYSEIALINEGIRIRGIGMIWGIDFARVGGAALSKAVSSRCFERGLIVERVGRDDAVLKILPPLTIEMELLKCGCSIIKQSILECMRSSA
jgi:diaminobutyrate-2-oxoglutarate transaminase